MSYYKIIGFAVLGVFAVTVMRKMKDEYAVFISLFCGTALTASAIGILKPVLEYFSSLGSGAYTSYIFKSTGVAVITAVSAGLCRDFGEGSLASRLEACGKAVILTMCLPLLKGIFKSVLDLIG